MRLWLCIAAVLLAACGGDDPTDPPDAATVEDMQLASLDPTTVVPGSTLVVGGSGLFPDFAGPTTLYLDGALDGAAVSVKLDARFVDYEHLEVSWPGGQQAGLPTPSGIFEGTAHLQTTSNLDRKTHLSPEVSAVLDVREALTPDLLVLDNQVTFVNDWLVVEGDGFLLGEGEGYTAAVVEGCYTPNEAQGCTPVGPVEVAAEPIEPFDRHALRFPFSPHIAGIQPGSFTGSVSLVNHHGTGIDEASATSLDTDNTISEPVITNFTPGEASLGQYVDVAGGGFVGAGPGEPSSLAVTLIELEGTFTPEGGPPIATSLSLVPEFVEGRLVRYVVNEEDELGQAIDVRYTPGLFEGTARPVTEFLDEVVTGSSSSVTLGLRPVEQVVWLKFLPTYVESLRRFGLREADALVRTRVAEVVARDYSGINLAVRLEEPTDFALFAGVEIGGPDPNGIGLLGYDNTPGKDDGNLRLYDEIGGVNALTQQDGYPGYGGVFVESLFIFSEHPNGLAPADGSVDVRFDQLFDPFRPDEGTPLTSDEAAGVTLPIDGTLCPASDRATQASCAVWALGNLIGTTVSHEVAHSLGLADPGGEGFHNDGDFPNALMDAGSARTFGERAEIAGEGPGRFCAHNYAYLKQVLPSSAPDPLAERPQCQ